MTKKSRLKTLWYLLPVVLFIIFSNSALICRANCSDMGCLACVGYIVIGIILVISSLSYVFFMLKYGFWKGIVYGTLILFTLYVLLQVLIRL